MTQLDLEKIEYCRSLGILNETALRNHVIRNEFEELKKARIDSTVSVELLANKFYLGKSRIYKIVYQQKRAPK